MRTLVRRQLSSRHAGFEEVSPQAGGLDARAFTAQLERDGDQALSMLADMAAATDPQLRMQARRLARQLLPPLGRIGEPRRRGTRRMVARPAALDGDLDVERTLERSEGRRPRDPEDLVLRQFGAAPRAICLLVDRSGSMSGHAVALAAVAASAVLSAGGDRLRCSVVAFSADPMVLLASGARRPEGAVVEDLLSLRGHGTTDLARALRAAAEQLESVPPGGRTALLLSDALHTAGQDPLSAAGGLDCLHVLGTSAEAESIAAGQALARRGQGRYFPATRLTELTESLREALA